jgi:hypothetical protein
LLVCGIVEASKLHERALSPADLFTSAYAAQVYSKCASVAAVCLPFLIFGMYELN